MLPHFFFCKISYYLLIYFFLEKDFKERLITTVKKEVKQVMEESVTRKFVHEESGSVTSLCGAVEACLSQGKFVKIILKSEEKVSFIPSIPHPFFIPPTHLHSQLMR